MSKGFEQLKSMENWKLLSGSHTFPGPEGGTCINEAAIVAAGFPYREVNSASEAIFFFPKKKNGISTYQTHMLGVATFH